MLLEECKPVSLSGWCCCCCLAWVHGCYIKYLETILPGTDEVQHFIGAVEVARAVTFEQFLGLQRGDDAVPLHRSDGV